MINNSFIKRKFITNIVFLILGIVCFCLIFPANAKTQQVRKETENEAIAFYDAYKNNMVSDEYLKENSYLAYVDISEEPYPFASWDDSLQYAFIVDDTGIYLMRGSNSEMEKISESIKSTGTARVMGAVKQPEAEVLDMAFEAYNEGTSADEAISREQFDEYFRGVAIYQGYASNKSSGYSFLVVLAALFAFIFLLIGIPGVISYVSGSKKLSAEEKEILEGELQDPRTVFVKKCRTFLTPNYLVYADNKFAVIPYNNILWAYKQIQRVNFIPIVSFIHVRLADMKDKNICYMHLFTSGVDQVVHEVFTGINAHNPETQFGFTQELQNYFGAMKYRAKHPQTQSEQ
jgi:hypothetical protein